MMPGIKNISVKKGIDTCNSGMIPGGKGIYSPFSSSSHRLLAHQLRHTQQIIRRSHKPCGQLRFLDSLEPRFPETSYGLHQTKDLQNAHTVTLEDSIRYLGG